MQGSEVSPPACYPHTTIGLLPTGEIPFSTSQTVTTNRPSSRECRQLHYAPRQPEAIKSQPSPDVLKTDLPEMPGLDHLDCRDTSDRKNVENVENSDQFKKRSEVCPLYGSASDSKLSHFEMRPPRFENGNIFDNYRGFHKRHAIASRKSSSTLLTEVLSWLRTFLSHLPRVWLCYLVMFAQCSLVRGSESPDRECCENPQFPVPGKVATTAKYPMLVGGYPEEPDPFLEAPEQPGVYVPTPTSGSLTCLLARQLCLDDYMCSQILQIIPRVCGMEQAFCSTITISKCQAALRTLKSFPFFNPTCLCKPPTVNDHMCSDFSDLLFDHPCLNKRPTAEDPFSTDALPYCTHANDVCNSETTCKNKVANFKRSCKTTGDTCSMNDVNACHTSWQTLRQSPIFGCICPPNIKDSSRCDQIFTLVNGNPCIGTVGPSQQDQEIINMKSTCHLALDNCEREAGCRPFLDSVKSRCVDSCNRERCMSAVQEFYRKIPRSHALDIAFCLCKKQNDDQCFRAQSLLHPVCAQQPEHFTGNEDDLPACHDLAVICKKCLRVFPILTQIRDNSKCRGKLSRYEAACAVDAKSKTCAGPYEGCRSAMLDILGTDLRTNCACTGTGSDFRKLFDCIGYQRLFWVNPCIVDAQKDFHLKIGNTEGPISAWTPTTPTYRYTDPPYRAVTTTTRRYYTTTTRRPYVPTYTDLPTTPRRRPPVAEVTVSTVNIVQQQEATTTQGRHTPFPPTIPPAWPQPPTLTTRRTRRTTRLPKPGLQKTTQEATTTTTTTLPSKYCKVEDLEGRNVEFIREGFEKRFYSDGKDGSNLCSCKEKEGRSQHTCTFLQGIEKKSCNTVGAYYSHASPFYQAYRGQCLCYSGQFICAKPDFNKKSKSKSTKKDDPKSAPEGVFLYLGYSRIDAEILKQGRMKLDDVVPLTDEEDEQEVKNTIQQTVSHFTSNTNKSDCRIAMENRIGENYILKATLDEFDEFRMKKNMSDLMKWKEKVECFEALDSISNKVNARDADMQSHIILSMFKVATAEANVPEPPSSSSILLPSHVLILITITIRIAFA